MEDVMAEGGTPASSPLDDRAQVRIFTLADYVAEESSGRLYISGGGLEWVGLPALPDRLSSFDLALRLAFPVDPKDPRGTARDSYSIEIRALDAEGQPVGPDPLLHTKMRFDRARLPDYAVEVSGNLPLRISDYPVSAQPTDVIFLHLKVDGLLISRLPVQLRPADQ
jgi:hypothetical protein